MSFHGYDPGDRNNWYQSPQLGLFPTSPTGYSGGYYCLPFSHPHVTQFPSQPSYRPLPSQFPFQTSCSPPPPPPSHTIINGFVFPHQFPSTYTHHSPDSNPNPWIYPSISQSHSYDPSITSVNSHCVSTKTMPTSPVYHSTSSIPTFQSPSVSTFVPQLQFTDPKPLPLHSKPFRGFRCRVVMGAKARVAKKTRNPDLLRAVGKYSRSKRYHRCGLWVIKARNGDVFPRHHAKAAVAIMEELHQLLVGQKTPITEPALRPLKFGSLPAPMVAASLTASGKTSSSATAIAGGSIRISEPNFNLSPHEAILDLSNDISVVVSGSSSEDNIDVGMTENLVLNVDKNISGGVTEKLNIVSNSMGASTGNRESEIRSTEGAVVTVKSIGKLRDGKEFLKKGHGEGEAPFEFKKDSDQVIEELDTAVVTMRKVLDEASLPSNFIDAIMDGVLCSIEAVTCIPQCLYAMCLNNNCFQAMKDRNALRCFVKCTSGTYLRALTSDKSISFSSGLGELLRHDSSLHGPHLDMLIEILNAISNIRHRVDASLTSTALLSSFIPVIMETDGGERNVVMTDDRESSKMDSLEQGTEPSSDSLVGNAALWLIDCMSNVAAGQSISTVFKNFLPLRYASLVQAECSFLRERQKSTNEPFVSVGGTQHSLVGSAKQTKVLKHLSSLEAIVPVLTTPGSKHNDILIMGCTKLPDDFKVDDHRCDFHIIFIQPLIAFYLRYIGKQPSLGRYDDSHAKVVSTVLNEEDMFVTVVNVCTALVFKDCPIGIVEVPEKWFLDAMNMNLETMIGKCSSVEKELHVVFLENSMKLDQKCLGYVLSNLDAPYKCIERGSSLVQYISDPGFLENNIERSPCRYENVISASQSYISQYDIVVGLLLLNLSMWLQLFSQTIIHNETTSATFLCVLAINCDPLSEQPCVYPKSPCELERAINWKKVQGYQVVLGIAALKLYLFYVVTVWSRIMVDVVFAILLSRISLIKQQYAWLQFLLGGSVAPMSTDDIDISNIWEFLAATVLLNNVERDENLIAALASSLGKDCSGCIKNGELDQSCKKIYLCHDQFKAFVRSNLYICKWFGLSVICVQGLTFSLAIILKALGLYHYYDRDDDYTLERVSLLNCSPPCVLGNTTYGSKYDAWHVLMIIFGDYLWTMSDQPKDNILIGDIELLGVLAIFISALVLGGTHDQLFWYYKSRIMKYLNELAQVFDIKSQMETLVDYQVSPPQKKICSSLMVDFILLPFTSSFGSLHLQLDAKWVKTSQHSHTLCSIAEIHVKNLKVSATHKYFTLCLMKIYEESCINGSVIKTKEKQFKDMVIVTSLGSDLDDEAGRPAKVLTDIDQASQACLFAWRTFSIATFLILGALLISVTHAMSITSCSMIEVDSKSET